MYYFIKILIYICIIQLTLYNMSIKLDQKIHRLLVDHYGGKQQLVKEIPQATLTKMSKGNSNVTVSTLKKALAANGMTGEIIIYGAGTKTTINFFE